MRQPIPMNWGGTTLDKIIKWAKALDQSYTTRQTSEGTCVRVDGYDFYFDRRGNFIEGHDPQAAFRKSAKR